MALRRTILVFVSASQQGEETWASTDGSFKRTIVALGEYSLSGKHGTILSSEIGRCSPFNIPGTTQVYQTTGEVKRQGYK